MPRTQLLINLSQTGRNLRSCRFCPLVSNPDPGLLLQGLFMHHHVHDRPQAGRPARLHVPNVQYVNVMYSRPQRDEFHPNRLTAVGLEGSSSRRKKLKLMSVQCHNGRRNVKTHPILMWFSSGITPTGADCSNAGFAARTSLSTGRFARTTVNDTHFSNPSLTGGMAQPGSPSSTASFQDN